MFSATYLKQLHRKTVFIITCLLIIAPGCSNGSGEDGKTAYMQFCATCHGLDRGGGNARTLFDDNWQYGAADEQITKAILYGIDAEGMPGFRDVLSDEQAGGLLAYLKSMKGKRSAPARNSAKEVETLDHVLKVEHMVPKKDGLELPWAIDFIDQQTALVTERPGRLRMVINGRLHPQPILDTPMVVAAGQGGLLDVAIDPQYVKNGWIYLGYTHALDDRDDDATMTRIVRGRIKNHQWVDQEDLFTAPPSTYLKPRRHYGTRIVFDRQGLLYFSIGDRGRRKQAQDLARPNGKIHRIHRDGSIPQDNPLLQHDLALDSIYSYGHRNPQGLAIHPLDGTLWSLEHGPRGGDELNSIEAGMNYGWPIITYGINYDGTILSPEKVRSGMQQPIYYWTPSTAVCGLNFYQHTLFPYWQNNLLVANLKSRDVRLLNLKEGRVLHEEVILKNMGRIREAVGGPDGAIYVVANDPDQVLKITYKHPTND